MGIFRRRSKNEDDAQVPPAGSADAAGPAEAADSVGVGTDERDEREEPKGGDESSDSGSAEAGHEAAGDPAGSVADEDEDEDEDEEPLNRARGPFDVTELEAAEGGDGPVERLDLGALRLAPVDGMQLRLELDETQTTVLSAQAVLGESSVQLQAFAAPRTLPVWPEIRTEIAENVKASGGTADVVRGELGRELLCRMPQQGPDGRTVFAPVRFAGVDGPRWFLRAVFSGPAAVDDDAAAPLVRMVRDLVVVRGDEAMPPREVLPLRLPQDAQPQDDVAAEPEAADSDPRLGDLKPFERGPEITEVR